MISYAFLYAANLLGMGRQAAPFKPPTLAVRRGPGQDAAAIFVHGFTGGAETWSQFISLFVSENSLDGWDIYSIKYPSDLIFDAPNLWSSDPDIETLASELVTLLSQLPLSGYRRISLISHSMGGLVVQRALINSPEIAMRMAHVFCFGTPSNGIAKAAFGKWWKRQIRDMASGSIFISRLRNDWSDKFGDYRPFQFWTVQGDKDDFVTGASSLRPFPVESQRVVSGNHLEIIRPADATNVGFQLVVQVLGGLRPALPMVDGARLAVEMGEFQRAVTLLLPHAETIDKIAIVTLALALDGLGRSQDALSLLERRLDDSCAEALGVLGGRVKRRWLAQRSATDLARARALYADGLRVAEQDGDHAQAYYHAINLAFLDLISAPATSRITPAAVEMAKKALMHCDHAERNHWNVATRGEAHLVLEQPDVAAKSYSEALALTQSPRERDSMYTQAVLVAERVGGAKVAKQISQVFGVSNLTK